MTTTYAEIRDQLPAVLCEWLDAGALPCPERDARVVRYSNGLLDIVMEDDGAGEFTRAVTDRTADLLVSAGLIRDAR